MAKWKTLQITETDNTASMLNIMRQHIFPRKMGISNQEGI